MSRTVAVVGRPNVGKSALVNRFVGHRVAIVEEHPGVTRDRKALPAEWNGRLFTVVDTGGWLDTDDPLDHQVSAQAERAVTEADLVLLVVDAAVGITAQDEAVARLLRRGGRPVLVVANKVDSGSREPDAWTFARLGLGDPWMVSAVHGRGTGDLLDEIVARLGEEGSVEVGEAGAQEEPDFDPPCPAVAVVGRPNVGKSTLFNRLVGEDRAITDDRPGTTRDSVDTVVSTDQGLLRLVDTAGMRRTSRVGEGPEYYSVVRALQSIDRADIALLVIDATEGITHQDQRLAERVDAAGSPVVVVLNKWECLGTEARQAVLADVEDRLAFLGYAPVVKLSALTGLGVHRLRPIIDLAIEAYHRRVPTAELNRVIRAAQTDHPASGARILYAVQGTTDPPTFTLFANHRLHPTYLRYIERRLREHFELGPTPLQLRVRRRSSA